MPTPVGNWFMKVLLLSPLHPMLGPSFAVITVRGRKTGKPISTPINVSAEADGTLQVVSVRTRTWWRNLRHAAPATLHVSGKDRTVRGEVVEDPEQVAAGLARYFTRYPSYARYFSVPLDSAGRPDEDQLRRVARERIIIHLRPVS